MFSYGPVYHHSGSLFAAMSRIKTISTHHDKQKTKLQSLIPCDERRLQNNHLYNTTLHMSYYVHSNCLKLSLKTLESSGKMELLARNDKIQSACKDVNFHVM